MSGDEPFLSRWSRRKSEAVAEGRKRQPSAEPAEPSAATPGTAPQPAEPPLLPPINTIDAASDIAPFLAAGVPPALTRAALRRAWTADPAIRNFIGLSENAWDFNAPDGVPGFGSLDADQVRRLIEEMIAEPKAADPAERPAALAVRSASQAHEPDKSVALSAPDAPPRILAAQDRPEPPKAGDSVPRRRHGGALPQF